MEETELYRLAIEKWGADGQIWMLYEEIGELMTAINQYSRGRVIKREVQEEIADVDIMLNQIKLIFGEESVDKHKQDKLDRLEKRINAEM